MIFRVRQLAVRATGEVETATPSSRQRCCGQASSLGKRRVIGLAVASRLRTVGFEASCVDLDKSITG